jgi:hypothetical protein
MLWKQGPSYWKCFPRLSIYYSRPRFIAFALPPFIIKEHARTCSIGGVCGTQLDSPEAKRLQRIRTAHFPQRCRCTSQRVSLKVGNAKKNQFMPVCVCLCGTEKLLAPWPGSAGPCIKFQWPLGQLWARTTTVTVDRLRASPTNDPLPRDNRRVNFRRQGL